MDDIIALLSSIVQWIGTLVTTTIDGIGMLFESVTIVNSLSAVMPDFIAVCASTTVAICVVKAIWGR